jgi:ketosteroid isomerase-like protein
MSQNKQTVETFLDAFAKSDLAVILSCLTEDIEWFIPGASHCDRQARFRQAD